MAQAEFGRVDRGSADRRRAMVDGQIRTFDVTDQHVLDMFYRVPREASLPASFVPFAYSDVPIVLPASRPGADGRALMQPMFLAKLLQGATLEPHHRVLIVAGATGYAAAIVAGLAAAAVSLDSEPALTDAAVVFLASLSLSGRASAVTGPLEAGHGAGAPYDRILVLGAVESGLDTLFGQLAPGGALLAVDAKAEQATRRAGKAVRFDKIGTDISRRALFDATIPVLDAFRDKPGFVF